MDLTKDTITTKTKLFYGIGLLATTLFTGLVNGSHYIFYIDYMFLHPFGYIVISIFYIIWNSFNDPLFGYLSDKTKKEGVGRRSYWLRISSLFFGLSFIIFWFPLTINQVTLALSLGINYLIFDTLYTIFGLNHGALLPEMTNDPVERVSIQIFTGFVGVTGIIINFIAPVLFFTANLPPSTVIVNFWIFAIIIAIIGSVTAIVFSFNVKEKEEFQREEPLGIKDALKYSLKNRSFITYGIFNFALVYIVFVIPAGLTLYLKYVFISMDLLFISVIIGVGFAIPLLLIFFKNMRSVGLQKICFIYSLLAVVGFFILYFVRDPIFFGIVLGLVVPSFIIYGMCINSLLADVIDEDELKTGRRREGMYFGVNALVTKPANSVGNMILAGVQVATGYIAGAAIQGPLAIWGIQLVVGIISALIMLIGVVAFYFHPIGKDIDEYNDFKKKVENLHIEKKKKLDEDQASNSN